MTEKSVEKYLKKRVEEMGGKCWKWVSPGRCGVPDRIVLYPKGVVLFVELKSTKGVESESQKQVHRILKRLGFDVYSQVDNYEKVDVIIGILEGRRKYGGI